MRYLLIPAVLVLLPSFGCSRAAPTFSVTDVLTAVKEHDAAVRARIVEVGESPGAWSGAFVIRQRVKYHVIEVYYGKLLSEGQDADIEHVIVGGGPAEDTEPRLNPKLMKPGREVILFLYGEFPGVGPGLFVSGDEPLSVVFPDTPGSSVRGQ